MREIKFRAWDKNRNIMIGSDYPDNWGNNEDEWYAHVDAMNLLGIENAVGSKRLEVLQYTGLKDKKGKEIYEGDILENDDKRNIVEVKWDSAEFYPYYHKGNDLGEGCGLGHYCIDHFWEVIGNIYENPELLECK